jgi:hypothetical protein
VTQRVIFEPEASAELEDAALWYEAQRSGLGLAFVAAVTTIARKVTCLQVSGKITWTCVDSEEPVVLQSAARHGVRAEDALHAWAFAIDAYEVGEGMVVYVGPARSGALLEVGVVQWREVVAIVHAMPVRSKFLR